MNKILKCLLFYLGIISFYTYADFHSQDYFVRVRLYSEGKNKIGYIRYFSEPFTSQYQSWVLDDASFKDKKVIYMNRLIPDKLNENRVISTRDNLIFAETLNTLKFNDKTILHYVVGKEINTKTIDVIELDSLLWADEFYQEYWVDSSTAKIFQNNKVVFQDTISAECGGYQWVKVISFDPLWTKDRYNKYFKRVDFGGGCDFHYSLKLFHPEIQKAITAKKIFVFEGGSP